MQSTLISDLQLSVSQKTDELSASEEQVMCSVYLYLQVNRCSQLSIGNLLLTESFLFSVDDCKIFLISCYHLMQYFMNICVTHTVVDCSHI